jgi:hypothetical protein
MHAIYERPVNSRMMALQITLAMSEKPEIGRVPAGGAEAARPDLAGAAGDFDPRSGFQIGGELAHDLSGGRMMPTPRPTGHGAGARSVYQHSSRPRRFEAE